jgi:MFS family permease
MNAVGELGLLDRVGRRPLLIVGTAVMALALFGIGTAFTGSDSWSSFVALLSLLVYVAAFAISLGPIFWLVNAEIYPLPARNKAAGLCVTVNWIANFAVSLTFLLLIQELGKIATFWLYAAVCVVALIFSRRVVPETRGKRLEEIQEIFKARVAAR